MQSDSDDRSPIVKPIENNSDPRYPVSAFFPWLLVIISMLAPLAMTAFVPALPAIAQDLLVSTEHVQLVLSVSLMATAFACLAYGQIADVFGRRPALILGFGIATIGSMMAAFGDSIEWIIAGRALQAVGAGTAYVLVRVLVHDVYQGNRAVAILGYTSAAIAIAPMIGPLMGGVMIDTVGWRWIFASVGFMGGLLVLACLILLPETRRPIDNCAPPVATINWFDLLQRPDFLRYTFVGTAVLAGFYAYVAGAPHLMIQGNGMSATTYGLYYASTPFAYLLGSIAAGKSVKHLGRDKVCFIGIAGVAGFALIAFLFGQSIGLPPLALFGSMFGLALFGGLCLPAAQAGLIDAAAERPGMASGIFTCIHMALSAVVAQTVGFCLAQDAGSLSVTAPLLIITATGLVGYIAFSWQAQQSAPKVANR